MKYEQTVQIETSEYICLVKRIDGVVAQKVMESELIRCKDCKHRPKRTGDECNGFDFEFPDRMCPCQCEDCWYSRMPKDNWFCGNGERKEE